MANKAKALIGVIGGSGLYKLENLTIVEELALTTPWGKPSSSITIAKTQSGTPVAFLARHGVHHSYSPSTVPNRANIAALKSIGVRAIVAFSAVGSLREDVKPRDVVLPDQIIDRTKGLRPASFFDGDNNGAEAGGIQGAVVGHAMFGEPFDLELLKVIAPVVNTTLQSLGSTSKVHVAESILQSLGQHGEKSQGHFAHPAQDMVTLICMEGPQFSTRAESNMYRLPPMNASIINMSVLPEAKLAREAEISYTMLCTSTDYDAWRIGEKPVTVEEVLAVLAVNVETSKKIAENVVEKVAQVIEEGGLKSLQGSMRYSIMTKPAAISDETRKKLAFVLPEYWT